MIIKGKKAEKEISFMQREVNKHKRLKGLIQVKNNIPIINQVNKENLNIKLNIDLKNI